MVKWIKENVLFTLVASAFAVLATVLIISAETSSVYLLKSSTDEQIIRIYEELPASVFSLHNVKGSNTLIEMKTTTTWWRADDVDEWLEQNGINYIKVD